MANSYLNIITFLLTTVFYYMAIKPSLTYDVLNDNIKLDYKNKLTLNTYLAKEDISLENNKVKFLTNEPIFVHDNGGYNDETTKLLEYFKL
jgi:hypothetical protein